MPKQDVKKKVQKQPEKYRFVIDAILGPDEKGTPLFKSRQWYTLLPDGGFVIGGEALLESETVEETIEDFEMTHDDVVANWEQDHPGLVWAYCISKVEVDSEGRLQRRALKF